MTELQALWYLGLGVLLTVYALLDGFDLGVGTLHLFARGDLERRFTINAIGPLWDGNQVWLVAFGGALFAGFPEAYASILSAFYIPFILLLFFLIGRAVSIELRSKRPERWWRAYWDFSFFASSSLVTFVFGVLAGNLVLGVPIDEHGVIHVSLGEVVRPYPLAVGLLATLGAALHGSIFLYLKTEGAMQARVRGWVWRAFALFAITWAAVTIATLLLAPHVTRNLERWPAAWAVVVLHVLAIANVPRAMYHGRPVYAFVSSCATIVALCFLFGVAMFPYLAYATGDPHRGIVAWEASSSATTLSIMTIVAVIGMPLVLTYTAVVYWVFRGKVRLGENSY